MEITLLILGTLIALILAALIYSFLRIFIKRAQDNQEQKKIELWNEATNTMIAADIRDSLVNEKAKLGGKMKNGK